MNHQLRAAATGLVAVLVLAAGCRLSDQASLDAAEPADAPELSAEPAGTVRQVGPAPQGIAYDPKTDSLVVGIHHPERLLMLDPRTLQTRLAVGLPGKVRHLRVPPRGGAILVPIETADTFFNVDPTTGAKVSTDVQDYPHDAAAAVGGEVVVANEFAGSLSVIRDGEVVHTFDDLTQPGGVVVLGRTAVVVDVEAFTVSTYHLDSLERVGRVSGGEGPTHVAQLSNGRVAVTDTRGNRLRIYELGPLRQVASLALPGAPYGIASDRQSGLVWVTLTDRNEVVGVDVSGDTPREGERYPTVQQPDTVEVAPGSEVIWITGRTKGQVQRISR